MTAPARTGLDPADIEAIADRQRAELASAMARVEELRAELRALGVTASTRFELASSLGPIAIELPAGADEWTDEQRDEAYAVMVQAADDVRRGR